MKTRLKENQANVTTLLHTTVYFREKANRRMESWKISDAMRVYEIQTLKSKLQEEDQTPVRVEDIQLTPLELGLHKCPNKCLPLTIETQELLASVDTLREIYPLHYTEKD